MAIIGCGNIAALYDRPYQSDRVLTHAHAYSLETRTRLCAMVDVDYQKANDATCTWGGVAYNDPKEMLDNENIDIISICVPDEQHEKMLELCYEYNPKAVFCEKPLTINMESGKRIVNKYSEAGIVLAVNYSRRWDPITQHLKNEFEKGTYGKILNITGIYTKGILHNGSHLVDILRFLFGNIEKAIPLSARFDWYENDPAVDAFLKFTNGAQAHVVTGDARSYSIFEIDILCEKARFHFNRSGLEMTEYSIRINPMYPGYLEMYEKKRIQTGLNKSMSYAVSNIIDTIEGNDNIICSGYDALHTQKTCLKLIKECQK
ncbi:Gfo/Idh/MocA family protein [Methanolobus psychrotolerans]|uniref:Gfo/Idh/MocA family protein n=1 Tax=Methanolobus psychrotolerans TaxID=1874706 RepID=UPI0013EB64A5|nr:Gfo/Idh/MocA family oxidoreductase [Methanolobus psychrotolerans]